MNNKNFFFTIVILILITVRYCTLCYSVKVVVGTSMYPTLHDGDVVYASQLLKHMTDINRGDIVGITTGEGIYTSRIIKRVIGLPNEHVVLKNGKLYINDKLLIEPYLDKHTITEGEFNFQLRNNQFIVLGDNRMESLDSRDKKIGIISKKEIDFIFLKIKTNLVQEELAETY